MIFQRKDHCLFEELITHKELFTSTRNVSIVVLDTHASESRLLYLESDSPSQIYCNLYLFGRMNTRISCSSEDVKALVSDFVNHL